MEKSKTSLVGVHSKQDLATWIVRFSSKGEALKGSRRDLDLRRLALVSCARSAAELLLFREQKKHRFQAQKQGLKRSHSFSFGGQETVTDGCDCESCSLCRTHVAADGNSCYCKVNSGGRCHPSTSISQSAYDEESKLIDEFLSSLDGVPTKKAKSNGRDINNKILTV